jgi:hypothetical protein
MTFPHDALFDYLIGLGLKVIDYGTLSTERDGLQSATASYKIPRERWKELPKVRTAHPIFKNLSVDRSEINFSGPFAIATCTYFGIESEESDSVYDLNDTVGEDPIATHPDFIKLIGGTAMAPKNGANFKHPSFPLPANDRNFTPPNNSGWSFDFFDIHVPDAAFIGPRPPADKLNPFAGVSSYLVPGITWRRSWCRRNSLYDLTQVGKISIPDGPAPDLNDPEPIKPDIDTRFLKERDKPKPTGPRNWLLISLTQQKKGACFQCTKEWRASGPRGWIPEIYEYRAPEKKK